MLRRRARLSWWLANKTHPTPRALLFTWLVLGEGHPAKSVTELCSGGKYAPAPLSEDERVLLRKFDGNAIEHPSMPDDILTECPPELVPALKEKFGDNFRREMQAILQPAPLICASIP